MKKVVVITGGGSGMGLEAAKFMDKDKIIVISGRTESKLENAKKELEELGFDVHPKACDTSNRESVKELANFAASLGEVTNVINSAGVSPAMGGKPEDIMRINGLGTVYMNQEFSKVMKSGSVIVDVASNSAYQLPKLMLPTKHYHLADEDEEKFLKKALWLANKIKGDYQKAGLAYAISKNFVTWYAAKSAFEFGEKGIRVCSLSPGLIATGMGELEKENGGNLIPLACEKRMGKPEELGYALATVADERNGYLAGVDVLVDGGSVRGMKEFRK